MEIKQQVSASARLGKERARELLAEVTRVVVAKGKKVNVFDLKKDAPAEQTLLKHMLGPTGNLRAPTIKRGKTLLVGFNPDQYLENLG